MLRFGDIEYPSLEGRVPDTEWETRVNLAALYRAVDHFGWNDLTQAPLSARIPGEPYYLFAPEGILFDEVTASSLVKIDIDGNAVDKSSLPHLKAAWWPNMAVHAARDDANYVIHTHDDHIMALSARKERLLPVSQSAGFGIAGGIAYHPYDGVETYPERVPGLQASLGDKFVMILENHGAMIVGPSPWLAIYLLSALQKSCRVQLLAGPSADLIALSDEIIAEMAAEIVKGPALGNSWLSLLRKLDRADSSFRR